MIYDQNLRNLYIFQAIIAGSTANIAITVFEGTQPTAANITSSWSSASANYLQHWTGAYWTQPTGTTVGAGNVCMIGATPTAQLANKTGTATWGVIWASNVTEASVQSSTLPNANFIVGPVTDISGNGMIKMNSTSTTAGSNVTFVTDASIAINLS